VSEWVDGICGSGQSGTVKMWVWKTQEWTYRHDVARVDNAGVDNSAPCCNGWTLQEWTNQHDVVRVDNAGVDLSARCGKGGQCGRKNVSK